MDIKKAAKAVLEKTKNVEQSLAKYHGKYNLGEGKFAEIKPNPGDTTAGTRISITGPKPNDNKEIIHPSLDSTHAYEYLKQNYALPDQDIVRVNSELTARDLPPDAFKGIGKSELQSSEKSTLQKGLNALSIPQKILMRKTAQALGVELPKESDNAAEDADKASEALVEQAAKNLGISESSQLGAIGKAAAKTALDIGYDPLNALPIGKIAKATGKTKIIPKILEKFGVAEKAVEKLPSMAEREAAVLKQKLVDIDAQAAVDRLKKQRETARWEKLSDAEREEALRKHLLPPEAVNRVEQIKNQVAEERKMTPEQKKQRDEMMAEWRKNPELTPAEQAIQRSIDLEKERAARIAAPSEELEKTQPVDDTLKNLVKKVAKK